MTTAHRASARPFKAILAAAAAVSGVASWAHGDTTPFLVGNTPNIILNNPIDTYNLANGNLVNSFVPQQGVVPDQDIVIGRGLAVHSGQIYYTDLGNGLHDIYIAPLNGGAGGNDIGSLPSPRSETFIQDLDFSGGDLYLLTGYADHDPVIFKLNATTGAVLANVPLVEANPFDQDQTRDGFCVLPNGNFLVNSSDGFPLYIEYDSSTGERTGSSFTVPAAVSTGVCRSPDGQSLFFATHRPGQQSIVQTTLSGAYLSRIDLPSGSRFIEDMDIYGVANPSDAVPTYWNINANGDWLAAVNWTNALPDIGRTAMFTAVTTANRCVQISDAATAGAISFDNVFAYHLWGSGSLTLATLSGDAVLDVVSGSHQISVPVTLASDVTITVGPQTSVLTMSEQLTATGKRITKTGAGTLKLKNIRASTLEVFGGTVQVMDNGGATGTSKVSDLEIRVGAEVGDIGNPDDDPVRPGRSVLDLRDNKLIVAAGGGGGAGSWNGTQYTGVSGLVQRGYHDGPWDGSSGIVTSMSDATGGNTLTSIGIASNTDLGLSTFGGQSVGPGDTLVMYTYAGDANLDGRINGDDYFQIDSSFPQLLNGWFNGDFNYDGVINGDDYFVIDSNFPQQGAPFPTSAGWSGTVAVPEPASFVLWAAVVSGSLVGRRRRGSRGRDGPKDRAFCIR